jgi:hypothetical protein
MKINILILGMLLMGVFAMSFALAEDNVTIVDDTNTSVDVPEINASLNESYSGWKYGWTNVGSWLTFNQQKKAELELKLADMKLTQARIAAKNNNTVAMQKALDAHDRLIQKVQERAGRFNDIKDARGLKDSTDKLVGLDRAIEVHQIKIDRLKDSLQNENLTIEEKARIEFAINKSQNVTNNLQEVQEINQERMKTRLMAVANLTEDQADNIIQEIENNHQMKEINQVRKDAKELRKDSLGSNSRQKSMQKERRE